MKESKRYNALVERIRKFSEERDWAQFHDPKNLAISLQLECAEVLVLFQWTKANNIREGKESEIADELADVFYYIIKLADIYNIDLTEALEKKMDKNEIKYPVDKVKGKSNKYTEIE